MTPQTITITTARGETFTMNFDGPVSVEVKDAPLSPFEVGDMTPKFAIGDAVEWIDKRLGKRSGVVTDIIGHALKIGEHVTIWDDQARKVTPSTPPKFKVGDVVYWENGDQRVYGRVVEVNGSYVRCAPLTTFYDVANPIGIGEDHLHHDYRTVAGGGWRKCEVGKAYKARDGVVTTWQLGSYDHDGRSTLMSQYDLIEELP